MWVILAGELYMGKVTKSDDEWRAQLPPDVFEITRNAGTEQAFTGAYCDTKTSGVYKCVCCGEPLFDSATKYDSRSGWPSFYQPIGTEAVGTKEDNSSMMRRTEVVCSGCDAHLGHVFPDGPQPTGLRFCMNSASLDLDEGEG
jgi:peptide-methionine (R)-S-oxide reductase